MRSDVSCTGLRELYEGMHILHRDISLGNIMLNADPNAPEGHRGLVLDLGFATFEHEAADSAAEPSEVLPHNHITVSLIMSPSSVLV